MAMAKGISLNIGLNSVDPKHYGGWDGQLAGCENDANDMADIAATSNFEVKKLLTKDATVDNVKSSINSAAQALAPNDFFFLSYSGHGGQLRDENNDEDDYLDETWCLYDRQFVDDELNSCLREFKEGIKIFVLSDSCHSGTVVKGKALQKKIEIDKFKSNVDKQGNKYRFAPDIVLSHTYDQNKSVYDRILKDISNKEKQPIASVLLISGCQDNELSQDGTYNGYFTSSLKKIWDKGKFDGSNKKFHKLIYNLMMDSDQHPKYFKDGKQDPSFDNARPFTI
jgi:metacaspase-1